MARREKGSPIQHSTDSSLEKREDTVTDHATRYAKVYNFFGFGKAYNFPLCAYIITPFCL